MSLPSMTQSTGTALQMEPVVDGYRSSLIKTNSQNLQIEYTETVKTSGGKEEAENKLAAQWELSLSEVRMWL